MGYKEYEHPLWRQEGDVARKAGGHGGMDFIMLFRLLDCMRKGLPPDMDVYDAAVVVGARSAQSCLAGKGKCAGEISGLYPRPLEGPVRLTYRSGRLVSRLGITK